METVSVEIKTIPHHNKEIIVTHGATLVQAEHVFANLGATRASGEQLALARMLLNEDFANLETPISEKIIHAPNNDILIAASDTLHGITADAHPLTETELAHFYKLAKKNPDPARNTGVLLVPAHKRKHYISLDDLHTEPITAFIFGKYAFAYGAFIKDKGYAKLIERPSRLVPADVLELRLNRFLDNKKFPHGTLTDLSISGFHRDPISAILAGIPYMGGHFATVGVQNKTARQPDMEEAIKKGESVITDGVRYLPVARKAE